MAVKDVGIIVNGATGRIGSTQHLANALGPIRAEGGLPVGEDRIMPRLLLIGRDTKKLADIAKTFGAEYATADLDAALAKPEYPIFFDAAATRQRVSTLSKAIAAGKHIYSEKPVAPTVAQGLALLREAQARGLKTGAVEDKINLPGLQKLAGLMRGGFFGRVTGFRLEFGWWVFDGAKRPSQRPSWNYKSSGGGGLTSDMYPHWRYVIEGILGPIRSVSSAVATAIPERVDEAGARFAVDVDDSAVTLVQLESGALGTIVSSWATRVRRDDLITLQIDGTGGSAMAGVHRCWAQSDADTPALRHINPDVDGRIDHYGAWREVESAPRRTNPYRVGWEAFLRHVVADAPLVSDLAAGIRDVQFVEACYRSARDRKWVDLNDISE
jgi:predicted dehydrogenase